jgi:hypothetical protein
MYLVVASVISFLLYRVVGSASPETKTMLRYLSGAVSLAVPAVTGLVGLGRYSNECFPLAIAGGTALARVPVNLRRSAAVVSVLCGFTLAATMAAHGLVP